MRLSYRLGWFPKADRIATRVGGPPAFFARSAPLAGFLGFASGSLGCALPASGWIAFQIRSALQPACGPRPSSPPCCRGCCSRTTKRPSGHSAEIFANAAAESNFVAVASPACAASSALANAAMLLSSWIVSVTIRFLVCPHGVSRRAAYRSCDKPQFAPASAFRLSLTHSYNCLGGPVAASVRTAPGDGAHAENMAKTDPLLACMT
jgi:hypothetical protein